MKNTIKSTKKSLCSVLLGGILLIPTVTQASQQFYQINDDLPLQRLSSMYTATDQAILLPSSAPATGASPGVKIYNQRIIVPRDVNMMYVTIEGTALYSSSDDLALLCQVDGNNCLVGSGSQGDGSVSSIPTGWVLPLGNEYSGYDNSPISPSGFKRSWCVPVKPGPRTVTITGASAFGDADFYLEAVQVDIDVNGIHNPSQACGSYPTPNPTSSPD